MNAATATTVRKIQSLTWLIVLTAPLVACADEQSKTPPTPKTGYAEVNGLKLYYEWSARLRGQRFYFRNPPCDIILGNSSRP